MKQRVLAAIIVIVMAMSFTGCKGKKEPVNNTQTTVDAGMENETPGNEPQNDNRAGAEDKEPDTMNADAGKQAANPTSVPVVLVSDDFAMPIEDVFMITGRGLVVTGTILRGSVSVGAEIELVGFSDETRTVEVEGIEVFRKMLDTAVADDSVGIYLKNVEKNDVQRGQFLAAEGSLAAYDTYTAKLRFEKDSTALLGNRKIEALCYFFTTDSIGTITLSEDGPDSDGYVAAGIKMLTKLPMEEGTWFSVRQEGLIIAIGQVTELDAEIRPEQTAEEGSTAQPGKENESVIVKLMDCGANKIKVIKEIRDFTGLGLADAKALVDHVPSVIQENVPLEEAQRIKGVLEDLGATVEIED